MFKPEYTDEQMEAFEEFLRWADIPKDILERYEEAAQGLAQ